MKWCLLHTLQLLLILFLSGCSGHRSFRLPPVTEGWHKTSALKNAYIVQKKDTLYSIAWAFNVDYRYLAAINSLQVPYVLRRGQRIYISAPPKSIKGKIKHQKELVVTVSSAKPLAGWIWPTSGKVISRFNKKLGGNKGIDIGGTVGQPILACNSGIVVYTGIGISSYGKLIIIKHNDDYLSAYAYNQSMLVDEGQQVKTGQKIATMGQDNDGRVALHFEIRSFGKPVDPLLYLHKKL